QQCAAVGGDQCPGRRAGRRRRAPAARTAPRRRHGHGPDRQPSGSPHVETAPRDVRKPGAPGPGRGARLPGVVEEEVETPPGPAGSGQNASALITSPPLRVDSAWYTPGWAPVNVNRYVLLSNVALAGRNDFCGPTGLTTSHELTVSLTNRT